MFHFILFIIACIYLLYRLFTYKPKPPNSRFDWDALERDRQAGMSWDERQKKIEKNQYWTTEPPPKPIEHLPKVVDFGRYLKDKTELGIDYAERQRDFGGYMYYIKGMDYPFTDEDVAEAKADYEKRYAEKNNNCIESNIEPFKIQSKKTPSSQELPEDKTIIHFREFFEKYGYKRANIKFEMKKLSFRGAKEGRLYGLIFKLDNTEEFVTQEKLFELLVCSLYHIDFEDVGNSLIQQMQQNQITHIRLTTRVSFSHIDFNSFSMPLIISGLFKYLGKEYNLLACIEYHDYYSPMIYGSTDNYYSEDIRIKQLDEQFSSNQSTALQQEVSPTEHKHNVEQKEIDFDNMDGHEFENFCADILRGNGYNNVIVTRGSGDQGIDIIAYKDDIKYGIQCKCYATDVGNKAIQEVFSGKTFYSCHVGVVLTNSNFTKSAIELARNNGIILWNRAKLLELIKNSKE